MLSYIYCNTTIYKLLLNRNICSAIKCFCRSGLGMELPIVYNKQRDYWHDGCNTCTRIADISI